ncbi:segregation and condensation protein A [Usitatibacter palustris]|uniref:Segregation and condensation protein A n=1 Tax=Usitatibacter palustris TaxID=2732487 RepID=A0A6M4H3K4_9PROT|nr:Segregation and condensation protein A [Usitatibacter palustris]
MTIHQAANDSVELDQPTLDLVMPVARIRGEPLAEMPSDLYIPPEALSVFLEAFEGPLDLLLYLIRKHSLDILDIPMADLTRQYMAYVEMMRAGQLELAAEYLLMAALLIEIKSRMLLPRPKRENEVEPEDPRAELVRRLLEYERMKKAAADIGELPVAGRDFSLVEVYIDQTVALQLPNVAVADLSEAWRAILARAKMIRHHKITREQLSVRAHMSRMLRVLQTGTFTEFSHLFEPEQGVPVLVVSFLALLELARESLVEITQQSPFDPIYVKLKSERTPLTIT